MTTLDRNEIWAQAFELGQMILESPEVAHYKQCEETMESNPEIAAHVRKFRDLQDQYERLSEYGSGAHLNGMRDELRAMSKELDQYPEVQAYKAAMAQVYDLLQAITKLIAETITDKASE